jgi:hypothetical protein
MLLIPIIAVHSVVHVCDVFQVPGVGKSIARPPSIVGIYMSMLYVRKAYKIMTGKIAHTLQPSQSP